MTVKELRKILKQCEHQDAKIRIWSPVGNEYKISRIAESSIIAEVEIFLTESE